MLKTFLVLVTYFIIFSLYAQEERSFQIWNLNSIQGDITEKTRIRISEKIHYTPGESNLDLKFADISIIKKLLKSAEFGTAFRISGIDMEYDWLKEKRYMAFGKIFNESPKFEYGFINRFEYRDFDLLDDHFRYKQSFTLQFPEITSRKLRLYASEETYIKFNSENLHLVRLYAGLQAYGIKRLKMKLYYVFENYQRSNNWNVRDILGMNMSYEL